MRHALLGVFLAFGCGGKSPGPSSTVAAAAPASSAERDALWALVPAQAAFAAVITPTGVKDLESAGVAIKQFIDRAPELAPLRLLVDDTMRAIGGTPSLALFGMSPTKGFAYFLVPRVGELMILPVVDRATFVAAAGGTPGSDSDRIGDRSCSMVRGFYACATSSAALAALGTGGDLVERLQLVGRRGEIEIAVSIPLEPRLDVAVVIETERGGFTLHGAARGMPEAYRHKLDGAKLRGDSRLAGFGSVDLAPFLPPLPSIPIVPGAPLDALAQSIAGPLTFAVSSDVSPVWDIRLPLSDPELARRLVEHCDRIPGLAAQGAKVHRGVCTVAVPKLQLAIDAWIEGKELRIGKQRATPRGTIDAPTSLAKELATGGWSMAMYGRGTMFAADATELGDPTFATAARGLSVMTELGLGARVDGELVRVVIGARTIWANPDDVVDALMKLAPGRDRAGAKALAQRAPGSPFAKDHAAGWGGMMAPTFLVGIYTAIGVPTFMDYMRKSKRMEHDLVLATITKRVKAYHVEHATLPRGKTAITPAKSCCESPSGKCEDLAAWNQPVWNAMEMSLGEPHLFRYAYESDGKTFTARAVGDLDCDGTEITYMVRGRIEQGNVVVDAPEADGAD